jgi:hypothetical protein
VARTSRLAAVGIVLLLAGFGAGYGVGRTSADTARPPSTQGGSVATASPGDSSTDTDPALVSLGREAIEKAFPEFRDFESGPSLAGHSVVTEADEGDYYFAYLVLGSGVPIAQATCFRVDRVGRVFETGVFPDPVDSFAGYRHVDPRNCRGVQ